jgi:hypothetical protein
MSEKNEKQLPIELGIAHKRAVKLSENWLIDFVETEDYCETFKAVMVNNELTQEERFFGCYMIGCFNADQSGDMGSIYLNLKKSRNEPLPKHLQELRDEIEKLTK